MNFKKLFTIRSTMTKWNEHAQTGEWKNSSNVKTKTYKTCGGKLSGKKISEEKVHGDAMNSVQNNKTSDC